MSQKRTPAGCALKLGFAETAGLSFKFPTANLTFKLGGAGFPRGRVGPFGTGQRMTTGMPVSLRETLLCSTRFLTATATAHFVPDRNPKLQFWPCLPLASGEPPSGDDDSLLQDSIAIRRKERLQSTAKELAQPRPRIPLSAEWRTEIERCIVTARAELVRRGEAVS